jgi:HEAT repeat protein
MNSKNAMVQGKRKIRHLRGLICVLSLALAYPVEAKKKPVESAKSTKDSKPAAIPATSEKVKPEPSTSHPKLLERIREALKFGNSQQVRDALNTLSRLSEAEQRTLLPDLKKTCQSQDGLVLRKMAEFIGNAPFSDLDSELQGFLGDKDNDQLFYATVGALAKKKPASALPAIIQEIRDQDFSKAGNRIPDAVHLLTIYKDRSLQAFLLEKLEAADTYADYRSGILKYLGEATPWSEPLKTKVIKLFQDDVEPLTVRGSAAYSLGKAQIDSAKPALKAALAKIEALKNNDEKKRYTRFRMQIIASLILLKDNDVKQILFAMARDDDEIVRARAVHQIGVLKLPDARDLLEYKSKYDPAARVQREAKKALALLDGKSDGKEKGEDPP